MSYPQAGMDLSTKDIMSEVSTKTDQKSIHLDLERCMCEMVPNNIHWALPKPSQLCWIRTTSFHSDDFLSPTSFAALSLSIFLSIFPDCAYTR